LLSGIVYRPHVVSVEPKDRDLLPYKFAKLPFQLSRKRAAAPCPYANYLPFRFENPKELAAGF
jgi:hypothetical protein